MAGATAERTIEAGLEYRPGEPVRVFVRRRERRYLIHDAGTAVALAGKPPGWFAVAQAVVAELDLNVNRAGVVFVPAVEGGMDRDWLASRVAEASVAVFSDLLEAADL
jgi:hypothetical protein